MQPVPIPTTPGLISALVGSDVTVAKLPAGRVTRLFLRRTDHGPADVGTVRLYAQPAEAGAFIAATFSAGAQHAEVYGSLDVTTFVYLRAQAGIAGQNLGGHFDYESGSIAGAAGWLTTLSRVKAEHGIAGTDHDAVLSELIDGVSAALHGAFGRAVASRNVTEKHDGTGWDHELLLRQRVADSGTLSVTENGIALALGVGYELHEDGRRLVRLSGGAPTPWATGTRNVVVSYTAGWLAIPSDVAMAATAQVRHEFMQTGPSGAARLGLESKALEAGGGTTYVPHEWLPMVKDCIRRYRRRWV